MNSNVSSICNSGIQHHFALVLSGIIHPNSAMPSDTLRNVFSRMRSRSAEKGKESVNEATDGPLNTTFNGLKILYNGENATIE